MNIKAVINIKSLLMIHVYRKQLIGFYMGVTLTRKANNRNTRKRCEICSKLTIKTPELCQ